MNDLRARLMAMGTVERDRLLFWIAAHEPAVVARALARRDAAPQQDAAIGWRIRPPEPVPENVP